MFTRAHAAVLVAVASSVTALVASVSFASSAVAYNWSATCRYIEDWTAMKTRWALTVDSAELSALDYASGCSDVTVTVTIADY